MSQSVKDQPIHVVFTWIDGSDPERKEMRKEALEAEGKAESGRREALLGQGDHKDTELFFGVQSLLYYAPWVEKIWIVTQRPQKPKWFDEFGKLLGLVHHDEIIPSVYLPTFSSRVIESCIHRIPGLAEQFIYFNDDMLLGADVKAQDFFVNGKPWLRVQKEWTPLESGPKGVLPSHKPKQGQNAYLASNRVVHSLLDENFIGDPKRPNILHQATPLTVSICTETEKAFPREFEEVRRLKFRTGTTITPIPLMCYFGLYTAKALYMYPRDDPLRSYWLSVPAESGASLYEFSTSLRKIQRQTPHLLCINDMCPLTPRAIREALMDYLNA